MKTILKITQFAFLCSLIFSLSSCLEDQCDAKRTFVEYEAIYVKAEEFRVDNISYVADRALENPGKIYYYNNTLMINERYEGIHLYDNTDPKAPAYIGFISIPGNLDVSIKDDVMYADNYVDLLTIDVSNILDPKLLDRQEEVFKIYNEVEDLGYFVYTKETERTIEIDCDDPNFNDPWIWRGNVLFADANATSVSEASVINNTSRPGTGQGGSFARFSTIGDYLYVLNQRDLVSYDIQDLQSPKHISSITVDWGQIETLFPHGDYLFIGGTDGMHIYDRVNPAEPAYVSRFRHARACDPVFVQGDVAYVTLRNGSFCESFTNQLDVIDISNIKSPQLTRSFEMTNPHGLAVVNDDLYICDGDAGLRIFDKSDLTKIDDNQVDHIDNINAYDIIPLTADHMIVVGDGGLYQYDSSNPNDLKEMSFISIAK